MPWLVIGAKVKVQMGKVGELGKNIFLTGYRGLVGILFNNILNFFKQNENNLNHALLGVRFLFQTNF